MYTSQYTRVRQTVTSRPFRALAGKLVTCVILLRQLMDSTFAAMPDPAQAPHCSGLTGMPAVSQPVAVPSKAAFAAE